MQRRLPPRFIIALLPIFLTMVACANPPASTVESFYHHVERGELEAATDLVSSRIVSQLGEDKLRAGLQRATKDIGRKDGIDEIEIVEEKTTGEVAEVTVVIHYGNGATERESIDLVQEDGEWKLQPEK